LEQLTYLLFLKMADEYSKPPHSRKMPIPATFAWETLTSKSGSELELHYNIMLRELAKEKGILGQIFIKSQNKIQDPAKLYKLIALINAENWILMGVKDKGDIYEGILEKNAEDTKSGAGQYFTPRPLIKAMVECLRPEPMRTIADPSCGTGGFFLAAYDWIVDNREKELDKEARKFLKYETFFGNEIVAGTRRLALMNLFLHNIGDIDSDNFISPNDSLITDSGTRYDYVLANPPFGKKSSMTFTNAEGEQEKEDLTYNRQDFWVTTSNKQLNFVQHIRTMLKTTGIAAVVLPDNVLFEGGVGETVRKKLLETTDLHTILRLPTGIFYANGVKANVLFFDGKPSSKDPWTKEVWVYDYRTNIHHTLKKNPLKLADLKDFITLYNPENRHKRKETYNATSNPEGRWRKFTYDEIIARDKTSLDISWLKDKSLADLDNLPDPDVLANDIIENLESGLAGFRAIVAALNK
jgi:type I restriction enzyme M protein